MDGEVENMIKFPLTEKSKDKIQEEFLKNFDEEKFEWFKSLKFEGEPTQEDKKFLRDIQMKIQNAQNSDEIKHFIWDDENLIQYKVFPQDTYNGKLAFGFLMPKMTEKEVKGKSYGYMQVTKPCILTEDKRFIELNEKTKDELKIEFETMPSRLPRRWGLKLMKAFIDGKTERVDGKKLLNKIIMQYEKYLFRRKHQWYKVSALWDIGTYLFMVFEAYPIYEHRGLSGTAKTKEDVISSFITFNGGQIMANPSEATLFRETEEVRGTKYFDEAEKLFVFNKVTRQYEGDPRTELINASYTKDAKVPRQEKILNKFVTKWYSPYSPTRICSINGLFGALETRTITQITTKSPNNDERGELDPNEDKGNIIWEELRDELYRFALENAKEIRKIYLNFPKDCGLKRRDLQIWKPLLSIAKFISDEDYKEVLDFAIELSEMRIDELIQESSFDYRVLESLKLTIETSPDTDKHYIERVRENFSQDSDGKDIYLNRNIATHLKKLGFDKKRDKVGTYIIADMEIFDQIVAPICPQLAFLSTLPTLSTSDKVNDLKKGEDKVKINVDSKNEEVKIVKINVDNVDVLENRPCDSCGELTSNLIQNIPICEKCVEQVAPEFKTQLNQTGGLNDKSFEN